MDDLMNVWLVKWIKIKLMHVWQDRWGADSVDD